MRNIQELFAQDDQERTPKQISAHERRRATRWQITRGEEVVDDVLPSKPPPTQGERRLSRLIYAGTATPHDFVRNAEQDEQSHIIPNAGSVDFDDWVDYLTWGPSIANPPGKGKRLPKRYKDAEPVPGSDMWRTPAGVMLPPPPKEWVEAMPGRGGVQKIMDFAVGPRLANMSETINTIMHGDQVISGAVLEEALQEITLLGTEIMPLGKLGKLGKTFFQQIRSEWRAGKLTRRKAVRLIENLLPEPLKAAVPKMNVWENFAVPLISKGVKKVTGARVIPTPWERDIPWKSVGEIWQPAIERAHQKGMGHSIRYSTAKRQLTTAVGEKFGQKILAETPKNRLDIMRELSGMKTTNKAAKEAIREYRQDIRRTGMTRMYRKGFDEWMKKGMDNLGSPYLKDPSVMARVDSVVGGLDASLQGKFKPKKVQKLLSDAIEDPILPDEVKSVLHDVHDLPFETSAEIARGSMKSSTSWMVEALKKRDDIVSVKAGGDRVLSQFPGLKGLFVDRDVELELRAMKAIPKMSNRMYNKLFMTPWKTSKVILRPATHFRNLMSNTILNDWGGLPFYQMANPFGPYWKSLRGLPTAKNPRGSAAWQEYSRLTGAGGTFSSSEVETLTEALKYNAGSLDKILGAFHDNPVTKYMRDKYNMEEQWFKLAKFMWNKSHGMASPDAALDAMKWTFNYGEVTRGTAAMRSYLAPFWTWQSKVLPLMAETAYKHPVRFAKWPMMMWGMQNLAYQKLNISEQEWNGIEQVLPDYIQDAQFGLMPYRDSKDRLQILNMTYILPGLGDIAEMYGDPAGYAIGTPLVSLAGALLSKTRFSGAPLYHEWESPTNKVMKSLGYVYQNLMPGLSVWPGTVQWGKMWDTIRDDPHALTWEQILASEMGLKITPLNLEKMARTRAAVDRIHRSEMARDIDKQLRTEQRPRKRRKALVQFNKDMQRLNEPRRVPLTRRHPPQLFQDLLK